MKSNNVKNISAMWFYHGEQRNHECNMTGQRLWQMPFQKWGLKEIISVANDKTRTYDS
jgi:hypothetical protein